jgi:hypothetical protein
MSKLNDFRAAMGEICAASSAPLTVGLHNQFDKAHDGIETAAPASGSSIFREPAAARSLEVK